MSPPLPTASRQNGPVPARPGSPALPGAGAQAMGSASVAMHEEAPPDERMAPCPHCGRTFRISVLERHIGICQKVFQEKRKVFNAVLASAVRLRSNRLSLLRQRRRAGEYPYPRSATVCPSRVNASFTGGEESPRKAGEDGEGGAGLVAKCMMKKGVIQSLMPDSTTQMFRHYDGFFNGPSIGLGCTGFRLCEMLGYEPDSLIGRSVLVLMPAVVSDAHAALFRRLREAPASKRAALLAGHISRCRDAVILDADGMPLSCRLLVHINGDLSSKLVFERVRGKIAQCVPRGFGQFLRQPAAPHIIDCQEVACIMTDVANTTRFATSQPPRMMAELLHQVYVTANRVVQREAHPYVYIHEAVGDSLLLLCNAEFMARYPGRTASIAIYVAAEVQKAVDKMLSAFADGDHGMYLRTGIALGPLCAGVVDGRNFRVFGSTIHLSQRLESVCPRSRIACCKAFTAQLLDEVSSSDLHVVPAAVDLKGFGTVEYSVVNFLGCSLPGLRQPRTCARLLASLPDLAPWSGQGTKAV
ncbi:npr2 [Symbiodinium sp. CCMP2456]|nr:npr2 [Symbiodinium sp. CCMP2456]